MPVTLCRVYATDQHSPAKSVMSYPFQLFPVAIIHAFDVCLNLTQCVPWFSTSHFSFKIPSLGLPRDPL